MRNVRQQGRDQPDEDQRPAVIADIEQLAQLRQGAAALGDRQRPRQRRPPEQQGGPPTTSHAPGRTITARPSASPRSITTPPSWAASRRCTDSASASSASPASTLSASASARRRAWSSARRGTAAPACAACVAAALEHDRQVGTVALDGEQLILVGAAEAISLRRQRHQTLGHRGALALRVWRRLGPPVGVSRPPRLRASASRSISAGLGPPAPPRPPAAGRTSRDRPARRPGRRRPAVRGVV